MIDTVLFDFDGTIMDTNDVVIASWQHAFITLEGKPRPISEIMATLGEPISDTVKRIFPGRDASEVIRLYRSHQYANYEAMISLFPGVMDVFDALKARGTNMSIVTNRLRETTIRGLAKYNIESYFGSIVCYNDAEKNKPEPEPAWLALKELGRKPENALFVGDSQNDILCGKNAGVKTVRVAWALASDDDHGEEAAAPDYIIEKPADLLTLIG
ncbi:MAG: HAD-IA family hydrolase [Clostridiales Family XIII bacterium]|jgi:pyrophosphatase PpaX|nr:HAD-IA family hydrolase [Clostridiales Family XIII bacterium]